MRVEGVGSHPTRAELIAVLSARLDPSKHRRPGRPTGASGVRRPWVPTSEETAGQLARPAELASTPERRISPMPIAAQLLEDAVAQCPVDPPPG